LLPREKVQLQSPALQEREALHQLEKCSQRRSAHPAYAHGKVGFDVARRQHFSQNSINTNKIEIGDSTFETKQISVAVKLASKFFVKMQEHLDDNSIPKDVPAFAKSFFVEATGGGSLLHHRPPKPPSQLPTSQPKQTAEGSAKVTARPSSKQQRAKKSRGTPPTRV
jgi:hypothetical protein